MKCNSYKQFFEVFANETRLKIIESITSKEMSVSEICEEIGEEQSKVSHNLKVLEKCNFVECRPDGKKRMYSLNHLTIKPLIELVHNHVKRYCTQKCWVKS